MKKFMFLLLTTMFSVSLHSQEVSLSTNLADYANRGTLNLEASWGFARHWSVEAGVKYNPFSFGEGDDQSQKRQRSIYAGAKYWPWHIYSGWWLSGDMRYQEYNEGGLSSPETVEGDRVGASVHGGYSYMVSQHFNLNLGAGVWAGRDVYRIYACPVCGRMLDSGSGFFALPSDIILSLAYIF